VTLTSLQLNLPAAAIAQLAQVLGARGHGDALWFVAFLLSSKTQRFEAALTAVAAILAEAAAQAAATLLRRRPVRTRCPRQLAQDVVLILLLQPLPRTRDRKFARSSAATAAAAAAEGAMRQMLTMGLRCCREAFHLNQAAQRGPVQVAVHTVLPHHRNDSLCAGQGTALSWRCLPSGKARLHVLQCAVSVIIELLEATPRMMCPSGVPWPQQLQAAQLIAKDWLDPSRQAERRKVPAATHTGRESEAAVPAQHVRKRWISGTSLTC